MYSAEFFYVPISKTLNPITSGKLGFYPRPELFLITQKNNKAIVMKLSEK